MGEVPTGSVIATRDQHNHVATTSSGMIALSARACLRTAGHCAIRFKEDHTCCIKTVVQSTVAPCAGNPNSFDGNCNAATTIIVHNPTN
eukprot:COSAG02_NODE_3830_length_6175_cov_4.789993_3_plen_89_part_00